MLVLLLALFLDGGSQPVKHVGLIELNHCYSCDGSHKFDQVILWERSPDYRRWDAHFWRIVKDLDAPIQIGPSFHEYSDGERKIVVRSALYRETWTTTDPERDSAKLFPVMLRSQRFCCQR